MKINIGGGYKKIDGYVNLDIDPNTNPDYVVDLEKDKLPFEDNSVDEVVAHHILEHLGEGYFHCLQELYRVCKNGATIDIHVPHHFHEVYINDPTHKRPITVEGMRLFSKKKNLLDIENGASDSCLGIRFNVDFEILNFNFIHDAFYGNILKEAQAKKEHNLLSEQEEFALHKLFRENVNTTIETHILLNVVKDA